MCAPVNGEYILFQGNLNEIFFRSGWAYFCKMNKIVAGLMPAVRVETRKKCIGLFVTKLR
jgi:hypothetical protein